MAQLGDPPYGGQAGAAKPMRLPYVTASCRRDAAPSNYTQISTTLTNVTCERNWPERPTGVPIRFR